MSALEEKCSFCDKSRRLVMNLIVGPNAMICNECIDTAVDIIEKSEIERDAKKLAADCARLFSLSLDGHDLPEDSAERHAYIEEQLMPTALVHVHEAMNRRKEISALTRISEVVASRRSGK